MKITQEILLRSLSSWRAQIAEAIDADDHRAVLRHLDASISQAEEFMRRYSAPNDEIDR